MGGTNAVGGTKLFDDRLKADIELSKDPNRGYNTWNKKRQEAIARGEDPNSELLAMIEEREPTSYAERAWRKLTGKKKTKAEEREANEAKERKRWEAKETNVGSTEATEINDADVGENEDDGIVRFR